MKITVEQKKKAIQSTLYYLTKNSPFLGGMLQELTIKFDERIPSIAGITYNKKTRLFDVLLHDSRFCSLDLDQRIAVLTHEILHFLHQHLFRLPFLNKEKTQQERGIMNIAGDMAINQMIANLPQGCVDVKMFKKNNGDPFPLLKSMEEYYSLLQQHQKNNQQFLPGPDGEGKMKIKIKLKGKGAPGEGEGQEGQGEGQGKPGQGQGSPGEGGEEEVELDFHDWDELSEEEKEEFLGETKKIIERTIEKTQYTHTELPGYVQDLLKRIETELAGINYKKILRDAIKRNASSSDREATWNKPNKRYGSYAKGTKLGKQPKLAFFNDSSGSISLAEQNSYLRIMDEFLAVGERSCLLAFWHTALYFTKPYKKGKEILSSELESGGTDVTCVMEYIKKHKPDLSIVLTDGYYSRARVEPDSEVIWIISKGGDANHPMKHIGKTIPLDKIK